jgi:hypothetical protein
VHLPDATDGVRRFAQRGEFHATNPEHNTNTSSALLFFLAHWLKLFNYKELYTTNKFASNHDTDATPYHTPSENAYRYINRQVCKQSFAYTILSYMHTVVLRFIDPNFLACGRNNMETEKRFGHHF